MTETHNPYTAPAAPVQDVRLAGVEKLGRPPTVVVVAVALVAFSIVYGGFGLVRVLSHVSTGAIAPIYLVATLARWTIVTLMCVKLWSGRNGARTVLAVLAGLSMLILIINLGSLLIQPGSVSLSGGALVVASMLVVPALYLAAVYLVYLPGREWFERGPDRVM